MALFALTWTKSADKSGQRTERKGALEAVNEKWTANGQNTRTR